MTPLQLFHVRIALVRAFLTDHTLDGILLSRPDNFAMATGGRRNYVNAWSDAGACSLFVHRDGRVFFVGNTIEESRMVAEELEGFGCGIADYLWFEGSPTETALKRFSGRLASDDGSLGENVNGRLAVLRSLLTVTEREKYRRLGALAAEAMTAVIDAIQPGMTEADIAACLAHEALKRRCQTPVILVAADRRIARHRHPLPVERSLLPGGMNERPVTGYAMVVGGIMKEGLVVSITRFKRVGPVPSDVADAFNRIAGVDALMMEATRPGRTLGDVFDVCRKAYADLGFRPDEWHNHHQGGATGYAARTCKGAPGETFPVLAAEWSRKVAPFLGEEVDFGSAFAWNPSAPGVKSEDTFILNPDGSREIVTRTPTLPGVDLGAVLGRATDVVKSGIAGLHG
jgi:Xaa-Pro dipeptidase